MKKKMKVLVFGSAFFFLFLMMMNASFRFVSWLVSMMKSIICIFCLVYILYIHILTQYLKRACVSS